MTDKIFIAIFYLFILWMCTWRRACTHHGAFTEVGGQLAKAGSLLLPHGSLTRLGFQARQELSHLTS